MKAIGGLLRPFGVFVLIMLVALSVSRLALTLWQLERVSNAGMLANWSSIAYARGLFRLPHGHS